MFLGVFNMVAFERIKSGIPQLDETLDNIRLGDNVVWQVSNLDEFLYFVKPFVKQAQEDNKNLIYINFGQHEPLIDMTADDFLKLEVEKNNSETDFAMIEHDGIKIYHVDRTSSLNLLLWKFITSLQKRVGMLFMYLTACQNCRLPGQRI